MESLLGALAGFMLFILIIVFGIYIAQAIFLNKFNKLVNGKGTAMAWIPIANIYLLGKLTVNKVVGWVLVICVFSTMTITTTINGVEKTRTILPESISSIISPLYSIAVIGLFIYAIIKYSKLKKSNSGTITQEHVYSTNQMYNQFNENQVNNINNQSQQPQMVQEQPMQNMTQPAQNYEPVQPVMPQQPQMAQEQPMQSMAQPTQNYEPVQQATSQQSQDIDWS